MIDEHPTKLLSQWSQQSPQSINASEPTQPTNCANAVYDPVSGAYLECRELLKTNEKEVCQNSFANELGRLSQRHKKNDINGANTLHFVPWSKLPKNKNLLMPAHVTTSNLTKASNIELASQ